MITSISLLIKFGMKFERNSCKNAHLILKLRNYVNTDVNIGSERGHSLIRECSLVFKNTIRHA